MLWQRVSLKLSWYYYKHTYSPQKEKLILFEKYKVIIDKMQNMQY